MIQDNPGGPKRTTGVLRSERGRLEGQSRRRYQEGSGVMVSHEPRNVWAAPGSWKTRGT